MSDYVRSRSVNRLPAFWYTKNIPIPIWVLVFLAGKVGIYLSLATQLFNFNMNLMEKVGILLLFYILVCLVFGIFKPTPLGIGLFLVS